MEVSERQYLLALNHISFLTPREKFLLYNICGCAAEVFRLSFADFEAILGKKLRPQVWLPAEFLKMAEVDVKCLTRGKIQCTFYWDSNYPPLLREIHDPPLLLFYRGELPDYSNSLIAVVGTRRPAGVARSAAYSLCYDCAQKGIGTVSGLARGIDSEAHCGSLDGNGYTCAVLGHGIDTIFPKSSSSVGRRILNQGGALLSEYPAGVPPYAHNFPARNRIISGLAGTVVIVQAPARSGALITADYALEQGRDVVVHSAGLNGVAGRGTADLKESGARVIHSCCGNELYTLSFGKADTGIHLAALMEMELEDRGSMHNGEFYLKSKGNG